MSDGTWWRTETILIDEHKAGNEGYNLTII